MCTEEDNNHYFCECFCHLSDFYPEGFSPAQSWHQHVVFMAGKNYDSSELRFHTQWKPAWSLQRRSATEWYMLPYNDDCIKGTLSKSQAQRTKDTIWAECHCRIQSCSVCGSMCVFILSYVVLWDFGGQKKTNYKREETIKESNLKERKPNGKSTIRCGVHTQTHTHAMWAPIIFRNSDKASRPVSLTAKGSTPVMKHPQKLLTWQHTHTHTHTHMYSLSYKWTSWTHCEVWNLTG